jgi:hypothetical protein
MLVTSLWTVDFCGVVWLKREHKTKAKQQQHKIEEKRRRRRKII